MHGFDITLTISEIMQTEWLRVMIPNAVMRNAILPDAKIPNVT